MFNQYSSCSKKEEEEVDVDVEEVVAVAAAAVAAAVVVDLEVEENEDEEDILDTGRKILPNCTVIEQRTVLQLNFHTPITSLRS